VGYDKINYLSPLIARGYTNARYNLKIKKGVLK